MHHAPLPRRLGRRVLPPFRFAPRGEKGGRISTAVTLIPGLLSGGTVGSIATMRTAIDRSGRIVIPKAIRDRLRLVGGEELEVVERDGVIEIRPAPLAVDIVVDDDVPVARATEPVPALDDEAVRDVLESVRR